MLEECYDQVDGLSLHCYYGNTPQLTGGSTARPWAAAAEQEASSTATMSERSRIGMAPRI